ncbi:MAG: ABC transporter permease, partial [Bryobacteraceae bacterium]
MTIRVLTASSLAKSFAGFPLFPGAAACPGGAMNLAQDIRFGFRMLWKRPVVTLAAVITLALGIGASSAILTLIRSVILNPLPFREPSRLVRVYESLPQFGWTYFSFSFPDYKDFRDRNHSFEQVAAYAASNFTLTAQDRPEIVHGAAVTSSFWPLIGVRLQQGRAFRPEEDQVGEGAPVVILSDGAWQRLFARDPAAVGKTITLDDTLCTVIGIAPKGFKLQYDEEVWVPLGPKSVDAGRGNHGTTVFARLRPGVTLASAAQESTALAHQIARQESGDQDLRDIQLVTFQDWLVGKDFRRALWLLAGAVGFLLLIACSNVANLLLARAA